MAEKKIIARFIIEMMGRPKEHLMSVMKDLVSKVEKERGISVLNKTIHEPKKIEQKDENFGEDLYSTFAEVEIETQDMYVILSFVFNYMPSHIEIISPENFQFTNANFNSMINNILVKLHHYDSIAKTAMMHNQVLSKKLYELQPESSSIRVTENVHAEEIKEEKTNKNPKKLERTKKKR